MICAREIWLIVKPVTLRGPFILEENTLIDWRTNSLDSEYRGPNYVD